MTPENQQKVQLKITAIGHAETINQQRITATTKSAETPQIIEDAQAIYDFLMKDTEENVTRIKPLVN